MTPATAIAERHEHRDPDDDVERPARAIGEQDQRGRQPPRRDQGRADEPEPEPTDTHPPSLPMRRERGLRQASPEVPAGIGPMGHRDPCRLRDQHARTAPDRPGRTHQSIRGSVRHGRAGAARFTGTRAIASPRFVGGARSRRRPRPDLAPRPRPQPRSAPSTHRRRVATAELETRSTYRLLMSRGLAPDEAADLTAFMCGIPIADVALVARARSTNCCSSGALARRPAGSDAADGESPRPH